MSETGESTAAINRRADDEAWPRVRAALLEGATLWRPPKLDRFHIDRGRGTPGGGSLGRARVRRLEAEGILEHVGVDRYALTEKGRRDAGNETPEQKDLF